MQALVNQIIRFKIKNMKPGTFKTGRLLLSLLIIGLTVGLVSWDHHQQSPRQHNQNINDTVPRTKTVDKKIRNLDEALDELNKGEWKQDLEKAMNELKESLKSIDGEKIKLQVEKALKEVDLSKLQQELKETMAKVDLNKMKDQLELSMKELDMSKLQEKLN